MLSGPRHRGEVAGGFPIPSTAPPPGLTMSLLLSFLVLQLQGSRRPRNSNAPTVTSHSPKTSIFSSTSAGSWQVALGAGGSLRRPCAHLQACSAEEEGSPHSSQIHGPSLSTKAGRLVCPCGRVPLNCGRLHTHEAACLPAAEGLAGRPPAVPA